MASLVSTFGGEGGDGGEGGGGCSGSGGGCSGSGGGGGIYNKQALSENLSLFIEIIIEK